MGTKKLIQSTEHTGGKRVSVRKMNRYPFFWLNNRTCVSGFHILMALLNFLQRKSIRSETQTSCSRQHAGIRHLLTGGRGQWSRAAGSLILNSAGRAGNAPLLTLDILSPSQRESPQKTAGKPSYSGHGEYDLE